MYIRRTPRTGTTDQDPVLPTASERRTNERLGEPGHQPGTPRGIRKPCGPRTAHIHKGIIVSHRSWLVYQKDKYRLRILKARTKTVRIRRRAFRLACVPFRAGSALSSAVLPPGLTIRNSTLDPDRPAAVKLKPARVFPKPVESKIVIPLLDEHGEIDYDALTLLKREAALEKDARFRDIFRTEWHKVDDDCTILVQETTSVPPQSPGVGWYVYESELTRLPVKQVPVDLPHRALVAQAKRAIYNFRHPSESSDPKIRALASMPPAIMERVIESTAKKMMEECDKLQYWLPDKTLHDRDGGRVTRWDIMEARKEIAALVGTSWFLG